MKLKYKYQSKYEEIIRDGNCDKLIAQVKSDRDESKDSWMQVVLSLSSIQEDEDMREYVKSGMITPVIETLIKDTEKHYGTC